MDRQKYLFLDVDGVLHRDGSTKKLEFSTNLIPIIQKRSLRVVVSSDWRRHISLASLKKALGAVGELVHDVTPDFYTSNVRDGDPPSRRGLRQAEIEFWLSENATPPYYRFALDDIVSHFEPQCAWLFAVDPKVGLDVVAATKFDMWIDMEMARQGQVPTHAVPGSVSLERSRPTN